jgi:hypothetical protein
MRVDVLEGGYAVCPGFVSTVEKDVKAECADSEVGIRIIEGMWYASLADVGLCLG